MAGWTEPDAVVAAVRRRWNSGELLRAYTGRIAWQPIAVPISGPRAAQIVGVLDDVRDWVSRWETSERKRCFRLEFRAVGGRLVGQNSLPARAHVESFDAACALLGVSKQIREFDHLLERTPVGPVADWARANPLKVLKHALIWPQLLSAVAWIQGHGGEDRFLREIDAPGVDTKFIEAHKGILSLLLDAVLPPERLAISASAKTFEQRYGFATKPAYIRWRYLDPRQPGFSEMTVRSDEFASHSPAATRVLVIENEVSYLALPELSGSIAIFGAGYNLARFARQGWLVDREVHYWGDIDTHGFAILHEFRKYVPHAESMLMDRHTLLAHRDHWSRDANATRAELGLLNATESEVYGELVSNVHGEQVRLEQERIRFSAVRAAVTSLR